MEYLWIVIVGGFISFFNSWGIGANDCANSFATSVGAKVLTLRQGLCIAAVFEFLGAFLMGSHVTDTVRKKIVDIDVFDDEPYALMLGMMSANFAAGVWLFIATYYKYPVSTTHSIIGAIIGFSLAYSGSDAVEWKTVGFIVLSWVISPVLSGIFSLFTFYVIRRYVYRSENSFKMTLRIFPILTFITFLINSFFIFYKGAPQLKLDEIDLWISIVTSFSIAALTALLAWLLYVPYAKKKINEFFGNDNSYTLGNGEINNTNVETAGNSNNMIILNTLEHLGESTTDNIETTNNENNDNINETNISTTNDDNNDNSNNISTTDDAIDIETRLNNVESGVGDDETEQNQDTEQLYNNDITIDENIKRIKKYKNTLERRKKDDAIEKLHETSEVFDPKVEKLCSWLQIITACFSSFAHGANDVANSIAPFATVYAIYETGEVSKKSDVPIWILLMGGIGIVLGLGTWGYKIIERIGRELTKVTASRGFIIELSAALTTVIASRTEMPVSTTHCQVGSVIGCGLADGKNNIKWKYVKNIVFSWLITLPVTGFISAAVFSYGYYSP